MSTEPRNYRVYCYDASQKMLSADWIEAADDDGAIEAARAQGFGTQCEIWEGKRLVAQLAEEDRRSA